MNLVALFCHVDDFCHAFEAAWIRHPLTTGGRRRRRTGRLCLSEMMTLLIWFHQSHYRDFKAFYLQYVCRHLRAAFPGVVSYGRFVELIPSTLIPLCAYLRSCPGACTRLINPKSRQWNSAPICAPAQEPAPVFRLSTRRRWPYAIPSVGISTGCLPTKPNGAKVRRGGFSAASSMWSSMIKATCSTWP